MGQEIPQPLFLHDSHSSASGSYFYSYSCTFNLIIIVRPARTPQLLTALAQLGSNLADTAPAVSNAKIEVCHSWEGLKDCVLNFRLWYFSLSVPRELDV